MPAQIKYRRPAAAASSRGPGSASLRAVNDATVTWRPRSTQNQAKQIVAHREDQEAAPVGTATAATRQVLPQPLTPAAAPEEMTATIAGLERRIKDNCLSLTEHYLQAIVVGECVYFFSSPPASRKYGSVENQDSPIVNLEPFLSLSLSLSLSLGVTRSLTLSHPYSLSHALSLPSPPNPSLARARAFSLSLSLSLAPCKELASKVRTHMANQQISRRSQALLVCVCVCVCVWRER